jgi:hypothetical protein
MSRAYAVAASIFTALSLTLGYWCIKIRWAPRIDFDILGFLWVLQNIAPLMLVVMTFFSSLVALYCWTRAAGLR